MDPAIVWSLCGSWESKQNRRFEFFCAFFILFLFLCTDLLLVPGVEDIVMLDDFCADLITISCYFAKVRKFGNVVQHCLYFFFQLRSILCAAYYVI